MDFTFHFSYSDDETDEVALEDGELTHLRRALRKIAAEATERLREIEAALDHTGATETTITSTLEAATISAAVDVIEAEYRDEGYQLGGGLKNLRYRIRGRRF